MVIGTVDPPVLTTRFTTLLVLARTGTFPGPHEALAEVFAACAVISIALAPDPSTMRTSAASALEITCCSNAGRPWSQASLSAGSTAGLGSSLAQRISVLAWTAPAVRAGVGFGGGGSAIVGSPAVSSAHSSLFAFAASGSIVGIGFPPPSVTRATLDLQLKYGI